MSIGEALGGLVQQIINILPRSPFASTIESIGELPYLGYLNWFIPIGPILTIMGGWLAAIAAFYLYSVIARWVKLIGD